MPDPRPRPAGGPGPDSLNSLRQRAAFAGTLAGSMGIGPFAVNAVSALSPYVVSDLGLTRTELGSLATVTFFVGGSLSVLGGRQVDARGGRRLLMWVFAAGGAAAAAMAGARSLPWLWLGAVLGGVAQTIANPATNQLIADHIPVGRRGLQIGIKQSGVQMAQALIGFVLPSLALLASWRISLLVGPLLAGLGLVAVWVTIPRARPSSTRRRGHSRDPVDPTVWWLAAYICAVGMAVQGVLVYGPLFAFERVGFSAPIAGMATGVLGGAGVVARILWSRLAEHGDRPVRMMSWLAAGAAASVMLLLASEHVVGWLFWPGMVGFGCSAVAVNAVVMLAVVKGAPEGRTGRSSGIVGLGLYVGFMIGPLLSGVLIDQTGSYTVGWAFVTGTCLAALAITVVWRRRDRSHRQETEPEKHRAQPNEV